MTHFSSLKRPAYKGQIFHEKTQTIPDQTMSMRTLLEKHSRGEAIGGAKNPIYQDEEDHSDGINLKTLDLVEIQEMTLLNADVVNNFLTQKAANDKSKSDKKETAKLEKAVAERLEQLKTTPEEH